MLSQMSIGMYYTVPLISIFYNMSTQHQIHVTYYMFVYYFAGNFIFGFLLYAALVLTVDRPIHSALNVAKDREDALKSPDYNLYEYLERFRVLGGEAPQPAPAQVPIDQSNVQVMQEQILEARRVT